MQKTTRNIIVFLAAGILLLTVLKSFYFTQKTGGTDLRIRIVASRLLSTDNSPYFYKWKPADGAFFLDPYDNASRLVNGNVVTPAVLYLSYPLAQLPYPAVRIIWTVLQLLATFAILFLMFRKWGGTMLLPYLIVAIGFLSTDTFLFHIERGQMYIFYALLFALLFRIHQSTLKHHQFLGGLLGGLFFFLRPFAGILAPVFLLAGQRKWMMGWATGLLAGCFLFVLPRPDLWQDYLGAMQEYGNELLGKGHQITGAKEVAKPLVIEGMHNLRMAQGFNISGLNAIPQYLMQAGLTINNTACILLYVIVITMLGYFFFKKKNIPLADLFLFAFLLYILAEWCLLTPRGAYNIIQWIFPLCLIAIRFRSHPPVLTILSAALLLMHNFPFVLPFQNAVAEITFMAITLYALFWQKGHAAVNKEQYWRPGEVSS